jgi:hypothetical protein
MYVILSFTKNQLMHIIYSSRNSRSMNLTPYMSSATTILIKKQFTTRQHSGRYRGYKYRQVSLSLSFVHFSHRDISNKVFLIEYIAFTEGIQPHTSTDI